MSVCVRQAQLSAGRGEVPCRKPRPFWIPWSIGFIAGALPSGTVTGGLQLHPRVPNGLGSALAGVAIPAAALNAIAAANNTFLITSGSP